MVQKNYKPVRQKIRPTVSIITINYKQAIVTNQLLASLQKLTWPELDVIVVDNNSGQESTDKIDTGYSNTSLIINSENLGFAGGNNVGIKASSGEYILLLNNDTEVIPGLIEPMIELLEKDSRIGAVSPKIKFYHHPDLIQYAGFTPMHPLTLRMRAHGYKEQDQGQHDQGGETSFAHGCAMMIPRRVVSQVGMMPEEYFLYYEEHDWSTAIRRQGYKIYYEPRSLVYHKESVSVQGESLLKTYFLNRNRILYMRRNHPYFQRVVATLFLLLISIPKNMITYLVNQQGNHLKVYCQALIWNLSNPSKHGISR